MTQLVCPSNHGPPAVQMKKCAHAADELLRKTALDHSQENTWALVEAGATSKFSILQSPAVFQKGQASSALNCQTGNVHNHIIIHMHIGFGRIVQNRPRGPRGGLWHRRTAWAPGRRGTVWLDEAALPWRAHLRAGFLRRDGARSLPLVQIEIVRYYFLVDTSSIGAVAHALL